MTDPGPDVVTIPARITVQGLAMAIGRELSEIRDLVMERGEPNTPGDYLSHDLAVSVARELGVEVAVEARDVALESLYQYETRGEPVDDLQGRAGRLVSGVLSRLDELDRVIESASEHWSVARMPLIDRNILRIGLFELEHEAEVPTAVVVAEAVRLAQTYSTEKSAAFVNGVLATLAKATR